MLAAVSITVGAAADVTAAVDVTEYVADVTAGILMLMLLFLAQLLLYAHCCYIPGPSFTLAQLLLM